MKATHNSSRVLIIDNYDSFTYNLVHLLQECGQSTTVWRNDQFKLENVEDFDRIVLSPGPGLPRESGLLMDVIRIYGKHKSILGVCLGLQAIAEVFGGKLYNLGQPVHGTSTEIEVLDQGDRLFKGLPSRFNVGRYHSWAVSYEGLPNDLKVIAVDSLNVIMAIKHKTLDIWGVQFHPESILSDFGKVMMENWLNSKSDDNTR